jgi:hypothetical protein
MIKIISLLLFVLLLFGCTEEADTCGNGICEFGEEGVCDFDCKENFEEEAIEINNWSTAQPFGIIDWDIDAEGIISLVLVNNSDRTLEFNKLTINQNGTFVSNNPGEIEPEDFTLIEIETGNIGEREGYDVFIEAGNIVIDYNTFTQDNLTQIGNYVVKISK